MNNYDVIILGAGAAGLFAAQLLGKKGFSVLVLEHNKLAARKVQISGGGRCNFTNLYSTHKNFLSSNPHFCKSALARFTPWDMVSYVSEYNIDYFEKKDGQLFCTKSSKELINMLLDLCHKNNVSIRYNSNILSVKKEELFEIKTSSETYFSEKLVVATGGLSLPSIGASDLGHKIARQFGHKVTNLAAALVPFTLENNPFSELSGVSNFSKVSIDNQSFLENILFTHKGLSGPAILQISSYWSKGKYVVIDLLPSIDLKDYLTDLKSQSENNKVKKYLYPHLSTRIVDTFFEFYQIDNLNLQNCSNDFISKIALTFNQWNILPSGTEGYRKAEVTVGGIDTDDISSKSMESKLCKSLFFIGEVLDVTGHLGGHNFQWAWASANACAENL